MSDPMDRLRDLPALLPDDGPPAQTIRERGRQRVRRRRLLAGSALAAIVLVAGAVAATAWPEPEDTHPVETGPEPTPAPSTTEPGDTAGTSTTTPATVTTTTLSSPTTTATTSTTALAPPTSHLAMTLEGPSEVPDGGEVTVAATGGAPGTRVELTQCAEGTDRCDVIRTKEVVVGDDGSFRTTFRVTFHTVPGRDLTAEDSPEFYEPCDPCVLRARPVDGGSAAEVSVRGNPSRTALVPWLVLAPGSEGPRRPGDVVVLSGRNFQPDGRIPQLGTCVLPFQAGVPVNCTFQSQREPVSVGPDGTFELSYRLPTGPEAQACAEAPQGCVIAEILREGAQPLWRVPITLS